MPDPDAPVIVWFRRDLRLADHPALHAAARSGRPVIPLYVLDETPGVRAPGAAARWWLDRSLRALAGDLQARGSQLILSRGVAAEIVADLAEETGAASVVWSRLYDGGAIVRDTALKAALKDSGMEAESFNAALLSEPWALKTKTGGTYKVFTPYLKALRASIGDMSLHDAPKRLRAPRSWPSSDDLDAWALHPRRPDWSTGFDGTPGEAGAQARLHHFIDQDLAEYARGRDVPAGDATSRLSAHLHWGEIGPRQVWRAAEAAAHRRPHLQASADKYLSELSWREFNHEILFHHPDLATANYKPAFDTFPWSDTHTALAAWKRGRTGYPMVDAGMRQLWATGVMHNRARMIAASFLIKHLLIDWRVGERWFWDTLVDADLASNTLGWQWVAGCGADAAPYFRVFNPVTQSKKFDPEGVYLKRWLPELVDFPRDLLHEPWKDPERLKRSGYPPPMVDLAKSREDALAAYQAGKDR